MILHGGHRRFESPHDRAERVAGHHLPGPNDRDVSGQMIKHPEHETGGSPRGMTRSWTGLHDDHDLVGLIPSWHRKALCTEPGHEDIDFFRDHAKARAVCLGCPVKGECLSEALRMERETRLCYGIWGGTTAVDREVLLREGPELDGVIYYGEGNGLIKIGTTRGDASKRGVEVGATILATEPGSYTREAEVHGWFAALRVHGEWFRPASPLMDYIASLPDQAVKAEAA